MRLYMGAKPWLIFGTLLVCLAVWVGVAVGTAVAKHETRRDECRDSVTWIYSSSDTPVCPGGGGLRSLGAHLRWAHPVLVPATGES